MSAGFPGTEPTVPTVEAQPASIARNSLARFMAGGALLIFSLVSGAITARVLGPAGKGALSALLFLGDVLVFYACTLGLGEAAIILLGRRESTLEDSLSASLLPLLGSSLVGAGVLFLISIPAQWQGIISAVFVECIVLMFAVYLSLFTAALNAKERFVATSRITVLVAGSIAAGTWLLVGIFELEILGAVLASLLGTVLGLIATVREVRKLGISIRPTWRPAFVPTALRYGVPIQVSYLLIAMSQRLDQLIVYSVAGEAAGGRYAIAITVGGVVVFAQYALSTAAFPRLAYADPETAALLTAQVSRLGLACGLIVGAVLLAMIPFLIPLIFGQPYAPAVLPALILVIEGIVWSQLWILARAAAARGRTKLKLQSFGLTVLVLLVVDLILIPPFGLAGAAVASLIAASSGFLVCLVDFKRSAGHQLRIAALFPRLADFRLVAEFARSLFTATPAEP